MTYASPFLLTTPGVVPTSTHGSWEPGHCWGLLGCGGFLLQIALVCWFMLVAPLTVTCFCRFDWHVVWEMLTVDDTCASRMFGRLSKVLHVFESGIKDALIRSSETEQHVLGNFHYWKFTTYVQDFGAVNVIWYGDKEPQCFLRHPHFPCAFLQIIFYC